MHPRLSNVLQRARILGTRLMGSHAQGRIQNPVFMIGCGRSGKSSLGNALALHPDLSFLDESRVLWIACFPCTDIWTEQAGQRGGRLRLDRGDANAHGAGVLSALFLRETKRTGKPRLMQALAANSFRVEFLHQVFPDAKFIHVVRNGLSVAQEIAQRGDKQGWWGRRGYKWQQIAELASRSPDTAQALALCENNFDRGLLEWRMSIEAIESARTRLPNEQFLEIRYEDIAERPSESLERAREFIGLADDALWERRALALMRRSHEPPRTTARQKDLVIGGAVLKSRLV